MPRLQQPFTPALRAYAVPRVFAAGWRASLCAGRTLDVAACGRACLAKQRRHGRACGFYGIRAFVLCGAAAFIYLPSR